MSIESEYKEVYFDRYCPVCKNKELEGYETPCEECLENPINLYSRRPIKWEAKKMTTDEAYNLIKEESRGFEAIYEDYIVMTIGENGLEALKKAGYLETCGVIHDRQLYTLVSRK